MAAAAEIRQMYGFDMEPELMERRETIYALQELTKKGYLKSDGKQFQLAEEMADIFRQIRDADSMVEIHKKSERRCILYIGESAIKVSKSMRRENTYEVSVLPMEEVWSDLQDEGWIPKKTDKTQE